MHKVEECNTYKKMMKDEKGDTKPNNSQVIVDQDKLKKGMAALFPSGDFDTDDLADALVAAMTITE